MKKLTLFFSCLAASFILSAATAFAASPAPENAKLYFISPTEGETLKSPVTVRFGLTDMGVAPAGIEIENTGHHHLIVDTDLPDMTRPVPADAQHIHFGKGQTETSLTLKPGSHTLQLLLGDHTHTPHQPPVVSKKISITIK